MDGIPPELGTTNPTNPLDQNMILKLVLEHVGKTDITDLFRCRLVNHAWNRETIKVLEQQHSYALELDYGRIVAFKLQLWNTHLSRDDSCDLTLASLRLSLDLSPNSGVSGTGVGNSEGLSNVAEVTQLLMVYPELNVVFLKYTHKHDIFFNDGKLKDVRVNLELFNLLKLVSGSLKSLTLFQEHKSRRHFEQFNFDLYSSSSPSWLEFPKLTTLSYHTGRVEPWDEPSDRLDLTAHAISIARLAPNLSKLALDIWEGGPVGTTDSIGAILSNCASRLQYLEIGERESSEMLAPLLGLNFPKLSQLRLRNGFFCPAEWIRKFLEQNCPLLTGLEVEWTELIDDRKEDEFLASAVPLLPNIVRFGMFTPCRFGNRSYSKQVHLTFTSLLMKLPSLERISIDLRTLLMLVDRMMGIGRAHGQGWTLPSPDQYPPFPNISTLEIQIPNVGGTAINDFLQFTTLVQIYHHMFPNLNSIILKPPTDPCIQYLISLDKRRPLMTRVIESFSTHPRIQSLEIHNYSRNWLAGADMGHRFDNNSGLQAQLKSLTLLSPLKTGQGRGVSHSQVEIKLPELISRFPALEFLQLGKLVVSRAEIDEIRRCKTPSSAWFPYMF